MTTEAELLAAVAADIDDRATWQVYLDWLLEREDPRAALVQLQTQLEDADDDKEKKALDKQIGKLLEEHGKRWLAHVNRLRLPITWGMHRGVVGHVTGSPAKLAHSATAILEAAPLLMSIDLDVKLDKDRDLAPLAGSPLLARARKLRLTGNPARVTGWEHLIAPELRALELFMRALGPADIEAVTALGLPELEELSVSWCRLNKRALEPLAKLAAPRLVKLDLPAAHVGPPLGAIVARFPALRVVRIPGNEIGSAGLAAMLPVLGNVTHLDLRGNGLVASDLPALLDAIPNIRVLRLGANELGIEGPTAIASWPRAQQLTQLDITHAGDEGARALARSEHLSLALEKLTLGYQPVSPEVENELLDAPRIANARIYVGMKTLGRKKRAEELARSAKPAR